MTEASSLLKIAVVVAIGAFGLVSCDSSADGDGGAPTDGKLRVVATTTMVADMARVIAGDDVEVIGLMAPGVDPHSYSLPTRAIANLKSADVVLYSGLKLEGRSEELYEPLRSSGVRVHAVGEAVSKGELIVSGEFSDYPDPHVWGDVSLWRQCIPEVITILSEARPELADAFKERGVTYALELGELHRWAKERVATVPEGNRILITSHDAFNYFGRAYGLKVIGVQGISTVDKAGLADIAKTVDLIKERKVVAVFVENSVAPDAVERIAADSGAKIGGSLFSDSMGAAGTEETVNGETYDPGTYVGMIKHNVNTVVEALGGGTANAQP